MSFYFSLTWSFNPLLSPEALKRKAGKKSVGLFLSPQLFPFPHSTLTLQTLQLLPQYKQEDVLLRRADEWGDFSASPFAYMLGESCTRTGWDQVQWPSALLTCFIACVRMILGKLLVSPPRPKGRYLAAETAHPIQPPSQVTLLFPNPSLPSLACC